MIKETKPINQISIFLIIALLTLCIVSTSSFNANAANHDENNKKEQLLEVKIPDSIYLYYSSEKNMMRNYVSPLIIVKNGYLINPNEIADKEGISKINEDYVTGKKFKVFRALEEIGEFSDIELRNNCCAEKPLDPKQKILPEIIGAGKYWGQSLPLPNSNRESWPMNVPEILIAPLTFSTDKNIKKPILEKADQKKIISTFRKIILPNVWKEHDRKLRKIGRHIIDEKQGYLFVADAVDLYGNGSKDFIGIYYIVFRIAEGKRDAGFSSIKVPFVLRSTGKIEKIDLGDNVSSSRFICALDIDDDGIKELFVEKIIEVESRDDDASFATTAIEILKNINDSWVSIWNSGLIDFKLGYFYYY